MTEAMGKILGMAMAYGVSSLGLFLAYVNYRRRTVGAEKVMTGTAWAVLAMVLLSIGAGVVVVSRLADAPPVAAAAAAEPAVEAVVPPPPPATPAVTREAKAERDRWPLVGILVPASIFLIATWVTAALHRHFTTHGTDGAPGTAVGDGS